MTIRDDTKEIKSLDPIGEAAIADMSDDTLADMWDAWNEEAEKLQRLARGAFQELETRMKDRGATHLETENWRGRMKPGAKNHTIDDPVHLRTQLIASGLTYDETCSAFIIPPPLAMRVDQRGLNELEKLGGEVAQVIGENRKTVQGDPRLVLEKKA